MERKLRFEIYLIVKRMNPTLVLHPVKYVLDSDAVVDEMAKFKFILEQFYSPALISRIKQQMDVYLIFYDKLIFHIIYVLKRRIYILCYSLL